MGTLRPLPSWGTVSNSAAVPPTSPACTKSSAAAAPCGAAEKHKLVPHGGTELRIGEMPLAYYAHASMPSSTLTEMLCDASMLHPLQQSYRKCTYLCFMM